MPAVAPVEEKLSKNLSLEPGVVARGNALAKADRRDFSGEVSWLIDQEFERRKKEGEVAA